MKIKSAWNRFRKIWDRRKANAQRALLEGGRDAAYPRLYESRLEDRRLLDGMPLAQWNSQGGLTVGAGSQANDRGGDQFVVSQYQQQGESMLRVTVNGQIAADVASATVTSLTILGSDDADSLSIDPAVALRDGIRFLGEGSGAAAGALEGAGFADSPAGGTRGPDTLILLGSAPADPRQQVTHEFGLNGGSVIVSDRSQAITYQGVERVVDQISTITRSFALDSSVGATLTDDGLDANQQSTFTTSTGVTVEFRDPWAQLSIRGSTTSATAAPSSAATSSEQVVIEIQGLDRSFNGDLSVETGNTGNVVLAGDWQLSGGDLRVEAGSIRVVGAVATTSGDLRLEAAESLVVEGTGQLSARGDVGRGGQVLLLGDRVDLLSGSVVDASGVQGGGSILIGGDYQGANPLVRNATVTNVEEGAVVRADALLSGDGGRIIVWSDRGSLIGGQLSVRGGSLSGSGGFVETSSGGYLWVGSTPDLSAVAGSGGAWLIDPNNLEIVAGNGLTNVNVAGTIYTTTNDTSVLGVDRIIAALRNNATVTVRTTVSGTNSQAGNITLSTDLIYTGTGNNALILEAHNDIILNGSIRASATLGVNNPVAITLRADSDLDGGGSIFLNNSVLSTQGGALTFTRPVVLGADVTITTVSGTGNGAVTFQGSLNADDAANQNRSLTINSGTGAVTFQNIGDTQALASLNVTSGSIRLNGSTVMLNDAGGQTSTFNGAVQLGANVVVDMSTATTANNLVFNSTVNADNATLNDRTLTVNATGGTVTFQGIVGSGATTALSDFDVTAARIRLLGTRVGVNDGPGGATATFAGQVEVGANLTITGDGTTVHNHLHFTDILNADSAATQNRTLIITAGTTGRVRFDGSVGTTEAFADLDVTGGQIELLGSNYVINDGAGGATSTWTGAITLLNDVTFVTDGTNDNNINFSGSIDSDSAATARSFTAVAGTGVVTLAGAVGGTVSLADLDVSAATLRINTTSVNVGGGAGGSVITINAAVILGANVTISTTGAVDNHLVFQSTINADSSTTNDRTLAINSGGASITLNGDVGAAQGLADLDVTAAEININAAQVRVTDGVAGRVATFTGAIRVGSNLTITTDGASADGQLEIRGTLDADNATTQDRTLILLAGLSSISIFSPIGTQQAFADLDITASTINLNTTTINVTDGAVSNTLTITGNTVVGNNLTITTTGAVSHNLSFLGSLNADNAAANDRTLAINAGTGTITLGTAGGSGNVGGAQAFADLDLTASTIRLNVSSVTVNDGPGNAQVTWAGNVILAAGTVTINTDGASDNHVLFTQTVNSDAAATLRNLTITAGDGSITFLGSVGAAVSLNTLSLTGSTVFLDGLANLDLRAASIRFQTGAVTIAGDSSGALIRFVGNVQVGANLLINTVGVNGPANSLQVTGTINADSAANFDRTLTINAGQANVTLDGSIGATQALADLDISAGVIRTAGVAITVNDGPGGMTVTFDGDVIVAATMTITTTGQNDNRLLFTKTINADSTASNRTLNLVTGSESATLLGSVGASQSFSNLLFNSGALLLGGTSSLDLVAASIRLQTPTVSIAGESSGALIRFVGDVRLQANVAINTTGVTGASNSLTFTETVNADDSANQNRTLDIQAGTGVVTFQGIISTSNSQVLADLDVSASLIRLETTRINVTDGPGGATITFAGKVEVGANLAISTDGNVDNNLLFTDTIDADDATNQDRTLTINAGTSGTVRFNGSVGATQSFADLDVTALQAQLGGAQYVVHDGAGNATSTWTGSIVLMNNVSFITNGVADNNLTFNNSIDADDATANNRTLNLDAGQGTVIFLGSVGATQALADLDIAAATIRLSAANYNIQDGAGGATVTFAGNVVVIASTVTINTDGVNDNKVLFTQSVNADSAASNRTLNLSAGNESITFLDSVGAAQALGNLSLTSDSVFLNGAMNLDLKVNTLIRLQTNTLAIAGGSSGALIRLIGNVQVAANLLINTLGNTGPANNMQFTGTINADSAANFDRTLTIMASQANVTIDGNLGATQAFADLDITAALIRLNNSSIVVNDASGGQTVTFDGDVVVANNLTLSTDGSNDNRLLFTKTINADSAANNRTLTFTTGSESATLLGSVGASQSFATLTFTVGSLLLRGDADQDITASNLIRLQTPTVSVTGNSTGALLRFVGNVQLLENVTITTTGATGPSNDLIFTGTVNADSATTQDRKLAIDAGTGMVTFQGIVGTSSGLALADLDVTAAKIRFQTSRVAITDGPGGATATFAGQVEVAGNLTITGDGTTDNNLLFTDTIDADDATTQDRTLTITAGTTGSVQLNGNIGDTQALADLDVTGMRIQLLGTRYVVNDGAGGGTSTWTGPVTLGNDTTFVTDGTNDNNLTFTSSIDSDDSQSTPRTLTMLAGTGAVTLNGSLGTVMSLADLDITAATIRLNSAELRINGGPGGATSTMNGTVVLGNNVTITTTGTNDNHLVFNGAINADNATSSDRKLVINTGGADVTFNGNVGDTQALADLDITARLITINASRLAITDGVAGRVITLQGAIRVGGNLSISADGASDGNVELRGPIDADDAGAQDRTLTIQAGTGAITFFGPVGGQQAFADLDLTASTITFSTATVNVDDGTTSSTLTWTGNVVLADSLTINTAGAVSNNLTVTGAINADNATLNDRLLTIQAGEGLVTLGGSVGASQALADLDIVAATIRLSGTSIIVNDGAGGNTVTFLGHLIIANNVTFNTDGNADNHVDFAGRIDADTATGTTDRLVTVTAGTGQVRIGGDVGTSTTLSSNQALGDFDITASSILVNAATIAVKDTTSVRTLNWTGAIVLGTNVLVDLDGATDNALVLNGTLNADDAAANDRTFTVMAGSQVVTFLGDVGTSQALTSMNVTASSIRLNSPSFVLNDQGGQTTKLTGAVILGANVTFNMATATTANHLVFDGTVNADSAGAQDRTLTVNGGTGTVTFRNTIGIAAISTASQALADLDVNAAIIRLQTSRIVVNDGSGEATVTFNGVVEVGANLTITTDGLADNHVRFTGTVDADDAMNQNRTLTIAAGAIGNVQFDQSVGQVQAFADLDVTGNMITLIGQRYGINDGPGNATSTWSGTLQLNTDVTFITDIDGSDTDNNLNLNGTVDSDSSATPRALTVQSGKGLVTLNGKLGGRNSLADLDINAGTLRVNTDLLQVNADPGGKQITINANLLLGNNVTINTASSPGNDLLINGTINGTASSNRSLNLVAGSGVVTITQSIGNDAALADFDVQASQLILRGSDLKVSAGVGGNTITLNTDVVLGNNVNFVTAAVNANNINFQGRIYADDATQFDRSLQVNAGSGSILIQQNVGVSPDALDRSLQNLSLTADTITVLASEIRANDGPGNLLTSFNGAVVLGNSLLVTTDGVNDNRLLFSGSINADDAGANDRTLTLRTGTATLTLQASVGDRVGADGVPDGALSDFDVFAALIRLGSSQMRVNDGPGGAVVSLNGNVLLINQVAINTDGVNDNHVLVTGTIDADNNVASNRTLSIGAGDGDITLMQSVGAGLAGSLADFDLQGRNIRFDGERIVADDGDGNETVTIETTAAGGFRFSQNLMIVTTGITNNNLRFNTQVDALDSATQDLTLAIGSGLGTVTFERNVGTGTNGALADLDVVAKTITFNGSVLQVNDGPGGAEATLNGGFVVGNQVSVVTKGTNDNSVSFNGTIDADNAATQDRSLTVTSGTGSANFRGDIGQQQALADWDVTAATIRLIAANYAINDGPGGNSATLTGAIELGNKITLVTTGAKDNNLVFDGVVNADDASAADRTLTVRSGTGLIIFNQDVGTKVPQPSGDGTFGALADLDLNGNIRLNAANYNISDGDVASTLVWQGTVQLRNNVSLITTGTGNNNVQLDAPVNADDSAAQDRTLAINSGTAQIAVNNQIGNLQSLAGLTFTAREIVLNGQSMVVNDGAGGQTVAFNGAVLIPRDLTITTDGVNDNNVTFNGTVDAAAPAAVPAPPASPASPAPPASPGEGEDPRAPNLTVISGMGKILLLQDVGAQRSLGAINMQGGDIQLEQDTYSDTITLDARLNLIFGEDGWIHVGTGANEATARQVNPTIQFEEIFQQLEVSVTKDGLAQVTGTLLGRSQLEKLIRVQINWAKALAPADLNLITNELIGVDNASPDRIFNFTYSSNPGGEATLPIPILITATYDPRIQLRVGEVPVGFTQEPDIVLVPPANSVQNNTFSAVRPLVIPDVTNTQRTSTFTSSTTTTPPASQTFIDQSGSSTTETSDEQESLVVRRLVFTRQLRAEDDLLGGPQEVEVPEMKELPLAQQNDLPGLYRKLENDRYRVYKRSSGGRLRLLSDVRIIDGQATEGRFVEDDDMSDNATDDGRPTTEKSSTETPATEKPSATKPSAKKPTTENRSTEKPTTEKPAAESDQDEALDKTSQRGAVRGVELDAGVGDRWAGGAGSDNTAVATRSWFARSQQMTRRWADALWGRSSAELDRDVTAAKTSAQSTHADRAATGTAPGAAAGPGEVQASKWSQQVHAALRQDAPEIGKLNSQTSDRSLS